MNQSNGTLDELLGQLRKMIAPFFAVSDGIALLDLVQSFATVSKSMTFDAARPVRPEYHKSLAIKGGRHVSRSLARSHSSDPLFPR